MTRGGWGREFGVPTRGHECHVLPMAGLGYSEGSSSTQWSVISCARGDSEEAMQALEQLASRYRGLIRDYLKALGRGEDAEDLTQEFFARKFLRDSFLASVHRGTGSFRKFLKLCVKRFVIDHTRRRVRPGGQVGDVALGVVEEDGGTGLQLGSSEPTADREMDRAWARAIIARARQRLEAEFVRAGKVELGASFLRELDEEMGLATHAEIAARLGMSAGAVTTSFYRFRERMKFLVRAEVEATVSDRSDLEEELRGLREAFAAGDASGRLVEG